ncbi:MBOAT family O-acyltransferase [Mucilaginibacter lacusdianchii]|uniref:MBOAT family O-acyltransferase n=1 Tax=Mucilaginibacter lacusdianchii TaxID=2684211 RepID=UPI001E4EE773|nr:MBOAT family O-acyltransferase [Mucilaginibacter sp. JXJ CY 39]
MDYYTGLRIYNSENSRVRKAWLVTSIGINLGFLSIFKYYNFFINSVADGLNFFNYHAHFSSLNFLLPVGISFYTFHGLSYVIDIYYHRTKPTTNPVEYSLFVSFFPLLVAGPIERATHLLPQIEKPRQFNYNKATSGLRQILWGFFKKIVIADNCADFANKIFADYQHYHGMALVMGAVMFSIQIYGDFSGYSDIALGTARLLGFDLIKNFAFPYFSRNVAEFWRRWHISLSSWFRDYVYIPLGGSRVSLGKQVRNTFIIFILSGFWHGANWTFIIWGFLNALFIIPSVIFKTNRKSLNTVAQGKLLPSVKELFQMVFTFTLITFAWIFFRAPTCADALMYIQRIFVSGHEARPHLGVSALNILIPLMFVVEWIGRESNFALENFYIRWPRPVKWSFYTIILFCIGMYMSTGKIDFIYFQF